MVLYRKVIVCFFILFLDSLVFELDNCLFSKLDGKCIFRIFFVFVCIDVLNFMEWFFLVIWNLIFYVLYFSGGNWLFGLNCDEVMVVFFNIGNSFNIFLLVCLEEILVFLGMLLLVMFSCLFFFGIVFVICFVCVVDMLFVNFGVCDVRSNVVMVVEVVLVVIILNWIWKFKFGFFFLILYMDVCEIILYEYC